MTDLPSSQPPSAPVAVRPSPASARGRRVLVWAAGVLVVFLFGIGAMWLAQVRPLRDQLRKVEEERLALATQVSDLEPKAQELEAVRSENASLKVTLAKQDLHLELLQAMAGVLQGQLAAGTSEQASAASTYLSGADAHLATLEAKLAGSQVETVKSLRARLAMAAGELGSDPFAAQRDLEVLLNGLRTLETSLFGQ